jgi:hypothetical protein
MMLISLFPQLEPPPPFQARRPVPTNNRYRARKRSSDATLRVDRTCAHFVELSVHAARNAQITLNESRQARGLTKATRKGLLLDKYPSIDKMKILP